MLYEVITIIEQITKQLNKLVDVVKVVDLSEAAHIERELMLIKVRATGKEREEMKRMSEIFRGRILDVTENTYTIELTGTGAKLDAFIAAIETSCQLLRMRGAILHRRQKGGCFQGQGIFLLQA